MAAAVATPATLGELGWGPEVVTGCDMQAGAAGLGALFPADYASLPGGSEMHGILDETGQPACQPCAWFYKESGCLNAAPCKYCHLCPQGELKNRKKKKIARLRSEDNCQEPAYIRVPEMELRRSKTAPAAFKQEADDSDAGGLGLDAGLMPPPGLDASTAPVMDPPLGDWLGHFKSCARVDPIQHLEGFDLYEGQQVDCGQLYNSWGAPWPLDPGAAYGYDLQLAFPMAFPPAPVSPQDLAMSMPSPTGGLLLPPPPEDPPALLEGGSAALHPPPPPEQSPQGALAHAVDQAQVSAWMGTSDDVLAGDFHLPCDLLPADLQAEIQMDQSDIEISAAPWETPLDLPLADHAVNRPQRLERAASAPMEYPFRGASGPTRLAEAETPLAEGCSIPDPPELERTTTQTAVRTEEGENGAFCVSWTVDARKLKASDKVAVSPAFQVPTAPGNFRMMLLPKVVDDRKGGASFKRAKGKGLVQVKCEENLEDRKSVV